MHLSGFNLNTVVYLEDNEEVLICQRHIEPALRDPGVGAAGFRYLPLGQPISF
jgi:hypothetical protein